MSEAHPLIEANRGRRLRIRFQVHSARSHPPCLADRKLQKPLANAKPSGALRYRHLGEFQFAWSHRQQRTAAHWIAVPFRNANGAPRVENMRLRIAEELAIFFLEDEISADPRLIEVQKRRFVARAKRAEHNGIRGAQVHFSC